MGEANGRLCRACPCRRSRWASLLRPARSCARRGRKLSPCATPKRRATREEEKLMLYRCNPPKEGNAEPVWAKSLSPDFLSLELVCSSILPRTVNVILVKLTDNTLCIQNLSMTL